MKKHQKHTALIRPEGGQFNRTEMAILGTPCGKIQQLSYAITKRLSQKFNTAYVDADHKSGDSEAIDPNTALTYGAKLEYIDKIGFHRLDLNQGFDDFTAKHQFQNMDLVLINGNHFRGNSQIVVIDSKKSLEKKLDRLTNVELILFEDQETIPVFIKAHIPNVSSIPTFRTSDIDKIIEFLLKKINGSIPAIKGLVLAGGESTRMQRDKGLLEYHGQPQRDRMYGILNNITSKAHISLRPGQSIESSNHNRIIDTYTGLGPFGAILSAFREDPNAAWLVVACDQPFLNEETLEVLIKGRNPSKLATAFHNPETDFPEPLVTLWEPSSYSRLLYFLSLGYSCPRKMLINSDIELLTLEDTTPLRNVNTPQELEDTMNILQTKK